MKLNWMQIIKDLEPIEVEYLLEVAMDRISSMPEERKNNLVKRVFSGNNLRIIKRGIGALPKQTTTQVNVVSSMRAVRTSPK